MKTLITLSLDGWLKIECWDSIGVGGEEPSAFLSFFSTNTSCFCCRGINVHSYHLEFRWLAEDSVRTVSGLVGRSLIAFLSISQLVSLPSIAPCDYLTDLGWSVGAVSSFASKCIERILNGFGYSHVVEGVVLFGGNKNR